jgi:hypothetical protein
MLYQEYRKDIINRNFQSQNDKNGIIFPLTETNCTVQKYQSNNQNVKDGKIPLAPMGVLAHGAAHA